MYVVNKCSYDTLADVCVCSCVVCVMLSWYFLGESFIKVINHFPEIYRRKQIWCAWFFVTCTSVHLIPANNFMMNWNIMKPGHSLPIPTDTLTTYHFIVSCLSITTLSACLFYFVSLSPLSSQYFICFWCCELFCIRKYKYILLV